MKITEHFSQFAITYHLRSAKNNNFSHIFYNLTLEFHKNKRYNIYRAFFAYKITKE